MVVVEEEQEEVDVQVAPRKEPPPHPLSVPSQGGQVG